MPAGFEFWIAGQKERCRSGGEISKGKEDGWRGVWGFGRHCAMTEKVHLEDLIPLTTESSDEMREGKGEGL